MLTPREREVAALVAKGMPAKCIAAQLGIAEKTVRAHIWHASQRLGGGTAARHQLTIWFLTLDTHTEDESAA